MRQKLLAAAFLAAFGTLPLASDASAAEVADRPELYSLGEVVVSGTGEGVQASETVYTVSAEEIRSKGARTLDQAIALLPGVNVRTGGEGVPRIDIRGFRTRHVLLLLDGVPMNSALDQQFDPTSIPTENIAQIKLTSGASSVLYGQGGLGGVINIITRKGSQAVQGMLGAETGDHEPYLTKASFSGASERVNFFLSGSASQVDGFPLSGGFQPSSEQGSGYRKNSDRERKNLLGTLGCTPNRDLSLGLTVNYAQGGYGKPASAISDAGDPFAAPPKYLRVSDYDSVSVQLAAEYAATRQLSLRGWTYFNHYEDRDSQYDNGNLNSFLADGSFRQRVATSIKGVTLQPKYDFGAAGALALSLGAEEDSWDNSGSLSVAPVPGGPVSFSPLSAHKSLELYSVGIEYENSPLPGLGLVAGYGHYWQNRSELDQDDYSLLAGASYDLFQETRLKATFKRNVRFPSLDDLYDLSTGNPLLAAEKSSTCEAGVEQKLPLESSIGLTGFYTTVKNLIQNDQVSGRNQNLADVRFAGAELAAATHLAKQLLLRATYAYLHSEDRSRTGRDQQQYTPGDKVTLEAKYDFATGFSPYVSLLYIGNQYFYTKNNVTPVQKARLNDYTVVNLKLSQRLMRGKATLYVGVDNLLDENFETSYGFPQAGRFLYGGVEFRL
jgi:outer membrane cobalamin receptor